MGRKDVSGVRLHALVVGWMTKRRTLTAPHKSSDHRGGTQDMDTEPMSSSNQEKRDCRIQNIDIDNYF
jgi:hypothetical protein